jgi:hypothetical protein
MVHLIMGIYGVLKAHNMMNEQCDERLLFNITRQNYAEGTHIKYKHFS